MTFDAAAVSTVFDQLTSHAASLGLFDFKVATHEPKNAPGNGLWCSMWVQRISPSPRVTGLAATSGRVEILTRIGANFIQKPEDGIDLNVLSAVSILIGEYSGHFTLGGNVIEVDLLGTHGTPLSAQAGYVQLQDRLYRVMDITVPVIIDSMWSQSV